MGITIELKESDEAAIKLVKAKYQIATKSRVLIFCLHNQAELESEVEHLQQEVSDLLMRLALYRKHSLELLSGISGLRELTSH